MAADELGIAIGYDEVGVVWLDGFIERQRNRLAPTHQLISNLGSYFGECMIHSFGGNWAELEGGWCVRFNDRMTANPFGKVAKHLANGSEDSVLSFFRMIPAAFGHLLEGK